MRQAMQGSIMGNREDLPETSSLKVGILSF
jgi:hypothetical protein